jgi:hypothetical protein
VQIGEDGLMFASSGCHSDVMELLKILEFDSMEYDYENNRPLSVDAYASLIASRLFSRRQMPFFSFCIAGGLSPEGIELLYLWNSKGYIVIFVLDSRRRWAIISLRCCWQLGAVTNVLRRQRRKTHSNDP